MERLPHNGRATSRPYRAKCRLQSGENRPAVDVKVIEHSRVLGPASVPIDSPGEELNAVDASSWPLPFQYFLSHENGRREAFYAFVVGRLQSNLHLPFFDTQVHRHWVAVEPVSIHYCGPALRERGEHFSVEASLCVIQMYGRPDGFLPARGFQGHEVIQARSNVLGFRQYVEFDTDSVPLYVSSLLG